MAMSMTTFAQDEVETTISADVVSSYIWRGQDLGSTAVQPTLGVAYKGLSLTAWGSYGLVNPADTKEFDLTLAYTIGGLNIGITDYWASGVDPEERYFFYKDKETPHQLEANLGFTCKYFGLQAYTIFWGNDYKINGDRAYSTYVELSVPFRAGGLDWDARVGITPMESAGYTTSSTVQGIFGEYTLLQRHFYYGEGFTCNMASIRATKNLQYKGLRLPVFAEIHTNPYLQKANFLVGINVIAF